MGKINKVNQSKIATTAPAKKNAKDEEKKATTLHYLAGSLEGAAKKGESKSKAQVDPDAPKKPVDPNKPKKPVDPKKPKKPVVPPPVASAASSAASLENKKRLEALAKLIAAKEQSLGKLADQFQQMLAGSKMNDQQKNNSRLASTEDTLSNLRNQPTDQYNPSNPMVFVPTFAAGVMKMLMQTFLQLMEAQIKKLETQGAVMTEETKKGGLIDLASQATVKGANLLAAGTKTQAWTSLATSLVGLGSSVAQMASTGIQQKNLDTTEDDTYKAASNKLNDVEYVPVDGDPSPGYAGSPLTEKQQAHAEAYQHLKDHPEEFLGASESKVDLQTNNDEIIFAGRLTKKGKGTALVPLKMVPKKDTAAVTANGVERSVEIPGTNGEKMTMTDILKGVPKSERKELKAVLKQRSEKAETQLKNKMDKIGQTTQIVQQSFEVLKGIGSATSGELQAASQAQKGQQDADAQRFQSLIKIFDSVISQLQASASAAQSGSDATKQVLQAIMQSAGRG